MNDHTNAPPTAENLTPLQRKLAAYKAKHDGTESFTLPETGVVVEFPRFRFHGMILASHKEAGNDPAMVQVVYATRYCTFDGESITVDQFMREFPDDDTAALIRKLFSTATVTVVGEDGKPRPT